MLRSFVVMSLLAVALTGCFKANYTTGLPSSGEIHKAKVHHVLGLGGGSIAATERCGNGVAAINTQMGVADVIVSALTGTIYRPTSVKIECAAATAQLSR